MRARPSFPAKSRATTRTVVYDPPGWIEKRPGFNRRFVTVRAPSNTAVMSPGSLMESRRFGLETNFSTGPVVSVAKATVSRTVVTGDVTQVDLPSSKDSGLIQIQHILQGIQGIDFVYFSERDVVRHPLVQEIVKAYNRYEQRQESSALQRPS